jgi:CBS domain-containing protein
VDEHGDLAGVVTRRDILDPNLPPQTRIGDLVKRPPIVVYDDSTLREAADHMVREDVGRLVVVSRRAPSKAAGIITRSDLLAAHRPRLEAAHRRERSLLFTRASAPQ